MGKFISEWRSGALNLAIILLMAVGGPLVVAGLICTAIILPMFLFGYDTNFFDKHAYDITLVAILILGPYFIGKDWEKVEEFAKSTNPTSQKTAANSAGEPSPKLNPNYDDRGRDLNNTEKWLAIGFAVFCVLALLLK